MCPPMMFIFRNCCGLVFTLKKIVTPIGVYIFTKPFLFFFFSNNCFSLSLLSFLSYRTEIYKRIAIRHLHSNVGEMWADTGRISMKITLKICKIALLSCINGVQYYPPPRMKYGRGVLKRGSSAAAAVSNKCTYIS